MYLRWSSQSSLLSPSVWLPPSWLVIPVPSPATHIDSSARPSGPCLSLVTSGEHFILMSSPFAFGSSVVSLICVLGSSHSVLWVDQVSSQKCFPRFCSVYFSFPFTSFYFLSFQPSFGIINTHFFKLKTCTLTTTCGPATRLLDQTGVVHLIG